MFEIVAVRSPAEAEGRYVVSYRQVAHGIPIGNPRDIVFSADGKILSVEAALLDSSTLPDATDRMTDADALATAVGALELRYGAAGGFEYKHLAEKTSLAYRPMEGKWVPVWRSIFSISTNDHSGHYWVSVNVLTGETTIASAAFQ